MTVNQPNLRERKRQETAHALSRVAFDLAVEHGLDGYTIDDIAKTVGVSRRTFANYFSCKEEAITGLALEQLRHGIESMPTMPDETSLLDWVKTLAKHQLSGGLLELLLQLNDLAEENPSLQPYLEHVHGEIRRTAQRIVGERASNSTSKLTAYIIVGAAYGALSSLLDRSIPMSRSSPEQVIDKVFSQLRSGM